MKTFLQFIKEQSDMFKPLAHNDLTKRPHRITTFIDKMRANEGFVTTKGVVKLNHTQTIAGKSVSIDDIATAMTKSGLSMIFKGVDEHNTPVDVKYPAEFFKTGEFGGKGIGSGTAVEDTALKAFRKEIESIIQNTGIPYVPIKINGRVVNAVGVESTPGTPKSDFHIIDASGHEALWISHKDGSSAKDFQQYGGLTELLKAFPTDQFIKKFIEDVRVASKGELTGEVSYMRAIPSTNKKLVMAAIYGVNYASNAPGRQNVDVLLQGPVRLKKEGNYYVLTSNHTVARGVVPTGDYAPQLFVRKGDRSNFNIKNGRFMVAPKALRRKSTIDI